MTEPTDKSFNDAATKPAAQEYEHVVFGFRKSSGFMDGISYQVTAYLLVPVAALPELQTWDDARKKDTDLEWRGAKVYQDLLAGGALLHRTDGPAYRVVEKNGLDDGEEKVTKEEFWEKGVQKTTDGPALKKLGRYTL